MAIGDEHVRANTSGALRFWFTYEELSGYAEGRDATRRQQRALRLVGIETQGVGTLSFTLTDKGAETWGTDIVCKSRNRVDHVVTPRLSDLLNSGGLTIATVAPSRAKVAATVRITDSSSKPISDRER